MGVQKLIDINKPRNWPKYSSFYLIITIINGIGADLWMNHLMKHSKHLQRETVIMQKRLNQCTNMEIYENRICSKINIIQFIQTILCLLAINRECANTNNCKELLQIIINNKIIIIIDIH